MRRTWKTSSYDSAADLSVCVTMAERVVSLVLLILLRQATAATLPQPCASVNQLPEPLWLSFTDVLSFLQKGGSVCDLSGSCVRLRSASPRDMVMQLDGMVVRPFSKVQRRDASFLRSATSAENNAADLQGNQVTVSQQEKLDNRLPLLTWTAVARSLLYGIMNGLSQFCRSNAADHVRCLPS